MIKEKQKTIKQHYVPQFYLRQWTDSSESFYPIRIENKEPPELNIFNEKSGPSRFCYENYFYAQHTGKEDDISQTMEEFLTEIETIFFKELPGLEKKILENQEITYVDKYHLSEFMLFLWIRGKKHRQESQEISERIIKEMNKMIVRFSNQDPEMKKMIEKAGLTKQDMIDFADKEEYSVDLGNMHHMQLFKNFPGFCNLLSAKYWIIYISHKGEFITTDTPYKDISLSDKFWGNDFLSREQSFVLSPRIMIIARYPKYGTGKNSKRKDITDKKELIQTINYHTLMNSIKFGFHQNKKLLEELKIFIQEFYKFRVNKLI